MIEARASPAEPLCADGRLPLLIRISECWWHKNGKELNKPHLPPRRVRGAKPGSHYLSYVPIPELWHWIRRHEQRAGGKARQWRRAAGPVWLIIFSAFELRKEGGLGATPHRCDAELADGWRNSQRWTSIHFFSG